MVEDAAKVYIKMGFSPVPIPPGEKGPRMKGWQDLKIQESDVSKHFKGNKNIGLILGEPSGGLTDVDIDSMNALKIAPLFLPETKMISGRASKPKSHYFYTCEGAKTMKFVDPEDGSTIIEIRSTGAQTVVPPSIHPSGERVKWS